MLHKRLLAAATATFLALGMAVGGASPAMAKSDNKPENAGKPAETVLVEEEDGDRPCDKYNYNKIDKSSGEFSGDWGSLEWDATGLDLVTNPGWTIDGTAEGSGDSSS